MRAAVFEGQGKISIREVPKPEPGSGQAVVRVTLTTICGTDVHILRAEDPVKEGLVIGHEPVGVIESVDGGVRGYEPGERVLVTVASNLRAERARARLLTQARSQWERGCA